MQIPKSMHASKLQLLPSFFGEPTLQTGCAPAGTGANGAGLAGDGTAGSDATKVAQADAVQEGGHGDTGGDGEVPDEATEPPVAKRKNESLKQNNKKKNKTRRKENRNKKTFNKNLKCVGVNAAGLASKLLSLDVMLRELQPSIFMIQETKSYRQGKIKTWVST